MIEDDIVQFRLVVLNEDDTVKEVVFESKTIRHAQDSVNQFLKICTNAYWMRI